MSEHNEDNRETHFHAVRAFKGGGKETLAYTKSPATAERLAKRGGHSGGYFVVDLTNNQRVQTKPALG